MPDNTSLVTTYVVNNSQQQVQLSLVIGGTEQTATSMVILNEEILLEQHPGDLFDHPAGRNSDLHGSILKIITSISDTAADHNHTELVIRLKGGVVFREFPLSKEVDSGGTASYYAEITFFNFS